jgi:carboxyl-terminal processing protease
MIKKILNILAVVLGVVILVYSGFYFGFKVGQSKPYKINVVGISNIDNKANVNFDIFWQAWDKIYKNYVKPEQINNQSMVYGAVKGLVRSLNDPYSEFFTPEESKKFKEDVQGVFVGIGAEIGERDGFIVVIAPLKNSPAERAGLKPGDKILMIDATSTEGMTVTEAVGIIRGKEGAEGTEVKLTILSEDEKEPREVKIKREIINIPTLEHEIKDNILVIKLYSFNLNASNFIYDAVVDGFVKNKASGIILDLRNNPGGYLDVAVDLAGWFLKKGTLVVKEVGKDIDKPEYAYGNGALANVPMVVLVNKGSASASEILAGALQINRGIKLIGEETFGKGTVQKVIEFDDGSSLKITIAHWVLPNGKILEGNGLKPDIEVKLDKNSKEDIQMQEAIKVLKEEIKNKK